LRPRLCGGSVPVQNSSRLRLSLSAGPEDAMLRLEAMGTSATESHAARHKKPRDCIPPRGGGRTNHDRNLEHQVPAEVRLLPTFAADTSPGPARSRPSCDNTISGVIKT